MVVIILTLVLESSLLVESTMDVKLVVEFPEEEVESLYSTVFSIRQSPST